MKSKFASINNKTHVITLFSNNRYISHEYDSTIVKDVDIYISDNGVLTITADFVVATMNNKYYYDSMVDVTHGLRLLCDGEYIHVPHQELDISNHKVVGGNWWWWLWHCWIIKFKTEYKSVYDGLQVKFVRYQFRRQYNGWELRHK